MFGIKHSIQIQRSLTFWIQWLVAVVLFTGVLGALTWLKIGEFPALYRELAVLAILGSVPAYTLTRTYDRQLDGVINGLTRLLAGWLLLMTLLLMVAFTTKTSALYSREVMLEWLVLGYLVQVLAYLPLHNLARTYHRSLRDERKALIVGTNQGAIKLADVLVKQRGEPMVGLIGQGDEANNQNLPYPVLGELSQIHRIIEEHQARRLYIALPFKEMERIERLYLQLLDVQIDVILVPDMASLFLLNHSASSLSGLPAIHLNESPLTASPTEAFLKSMLDRGAALLGIVLLSPLLITTAIAVKLSSPGPVLFKQERHGWNGKIIRVWKFRSMRVHQDSNAKQATRDDPRVTPVGRFIRRTSIDELPQLFNVLFGDMSLVGPRPHAVAHNDFYSDKIMAYMARHRIKPGITGLAQISGARGETETVDKMAKRVEFDLEYIRNWSLWLDIKILFKTPLTLISKDIY